MYTCINVTTVNNYHRCDR